MLNLAFVEIYRCIIWFENDYQDKGWVILYLNKVSLMVEMRSIISKNEYLLVEKTSDRIKKKNTAK